MLHIEQISCGDSFIFDFDYTNEVHQDFMKYSGDDSNIHTSIEFANKNGYDDVLGYAFALTSFLSNIYGTKFPGGNELCLRQECNFRNPFYIGDTITFVIEVTSINREQGVLELSSSAKTHNGVLIFTGIALLKLSLF
jgi:acyl dehydratase